MKINKLKDHLTDFWNILDLLTPILVLIAEIISLSGPLNNECFESV